jgi:hypothetical protein
MSTSTTRTRTRVVTVQVRTCACSTLQARVADASVLPAKHRRYVEDGILSTRCETETTKTYAPGHDARLAGLVASLARAEVPVQDEDGDDVPALEWAESHLSPALVEKASHVPARREVPTVTIRLADGTEAEAKIGRDGKARTESGDTHKAGTYLLV